MSNYKSKPFAPKSESYLSDRYQKSNESIVPSDSYKADVEKSNELSSKEIIKEEKNTSNDREEAVEDANVLGAKLLKAELMGDEELISSLKVRLEAAQKVADVNKKIRQEYEIKELTEQLNPYRKSSHHKKHKHKHNKHHKREKNEEVAKIMKKGYKGPGSDDEIQSKKKQKIEENASWKADQIKKQNEAESSVVENCIFCFDNAKKHLVISIGKYSYLSVPVTQSLQEGNCYIIPINHCSSGVTCDEEVWAEIREYRKSLVKMFEDKNMDCVFFEQYTTSKKYSHMIIECIPLDKSCSDMAPIYFKKAIVESESEWATNKSIINLKDKCIRNTIPKNMPYFTVDFGLDGGYAHIIENDDSFPDYFAKEIIGGILDLDPLSWRKVKNDEFHVQSQKAINFSKWWKSYDFNK